MPLVSVVIPTYNAAPTLARAIRSVLAQTWEHLEVIVVNDGSTDDTETVLAREFPPDRYPTIVRHTHENRGLAATRNAGAQLARGDYLALLDADDEWLPEKLERQMAILNERPDLAAVGCHRVRVQEDALARELQRTPSKHADGALEEIDFARELWSNRICGATMVIRRAVFERFGGYDSRLRASEDLDLWLRLLGAGEKLAVLREALYVFYDHPGSLRSNLDLLEAAWTTILDKWNPEAHSEVSEILSEQQYRKVRKWWWLKMTFHAQRLGDQVRARRYACTAAQLPGTGTLTLELASRLARDCPALFAIAGRLKGFSRPTG